MVFFADFLQLPPVKGTQPFIPVTFLEAKQRLGAIASLDLWKIFTYDELTINMRQSVDREYADENASTENESTGGWNMQVRNT